VLILDADGNRIVAKYYSGYLPQRSDQEKFESK
jgi:hypothetical protein